MRVYLVVDVRRVDCPRCGVKQERVPWIAANPHYTQRFARYVGKQCRSASIKEVATDLNMSWHTVKELDKLYMREQLEQAGEPSPRVIGIDELSVRKRHVYRIVVSDLEAGRPIWFGGTDRSEASLQQFFDEMGPARSEKIELAVMDMWRAFRKATEASAPQAAILYDKFHVLRQLNTAIDKVRKQEYKRLRDRDERKYIKGQKFVLFSHRGSLDLDKRRALDALLAANKRLHTAYVLKEQFAQLWEYRREAWARKFFDRWRAALRWQRLEPYEQFAALVERHWDGIAAYCDPRNKVSLGFVEGLNNKIRVIQRRHYGLHDEEYLRLKVLTSTLPPLPPLKNR